LLSVVPSRQLRMILGLYGAGGAYELLAGHDASRSLATMTMTVSDQYDELKDLTDNERQQLVHWEQQFAGTLPHYY